MAPLNEAVKVRRTRLEGAKTVVYEGVMDPTWNIGNVPCGGYSLALILEACIQHQAKTEHIDPLHISAHFFKPTNSNLPFRIRVSTVKSGQTITNLTADLLQADELRITSHAMFGSNVPSPSSSPQDNFILQPPSPYARRIPIYSHPSQATRQPMFEVWKDKDHVSWAWDEQTLAQNQPDHPKRKSVGKDSVGGGGTEWAAWYQFTAPTEKLSSAYIPFLADMFVNTTHLIPEEEGGEPEAAAWSPTLTLAIDFKFPIRLLTPEWHARRTAGLYSAGRFINYPQGRHDIYVEVWSAPSEIGEGAPPKEGWREKQVCLAVATQMALTLPVAVNLRNGKRKGQGGESKL